MTEHFYLPTNERQALVKVLAEVPETVENLARSMTIGIRAQTFEPKVATGERPQPLPFNADVNDTAEQLHAELARWVDWLCETRTITPPNRDIIPMARWLAHNILILAITPGSETAYTSISAEIKAAQRASGRTIQTKPEWDNTKLQAARAQRLSASGIATLATELKIQGLTRKRINNLKTLGHIHPIQTYVRGRIPIYIVGPVLDAHQTIEQHTTSA